MNGLQRIERAAQALLDRQDERRRAYAALIAAQHAEDQTHHDLRKALADYQSPSNPLVESAKRLSSTAERLPPASSDVLRGDGIVDWLRGGIDTPGSGPTAP